jgi:methionine sulfoxide reductase heme-binding subunit
VTWYLARATGLVLLVVFTASTALGVLSSTGKAGGRVPRFVATDLHRRLSMIALALLLAHITVSVADTYVNITWLDVFVPFVGSYRPLWLGLGTLASDVTLLVVATSLLRHRMTPLAWRVVHLCVYAAWPAVVLHGLGTGSDSRRLPALALTVACCLVVLAAVAWRVVAWPVPLTLPRVASLTAVSMLTVVIGVWAVGGPLHPGWAKKSGTPPPPATAPPAAAPASVP